MRTKRHHALKDGMARTRAHVTHSIQHQISTLVVENLAYDLQQRIEALKSIADLCNVAIEEAERRLTEETKK